MAFGDWLLGSSGGMQQHTTQTQGQQNVQRGLEGGLQGGMGDMFSYIQQLLSQDPQAMQQFEAPMMRQFEQSTVPMIAERFAGMGSHGAQNSSAMQQTMGQAGRELSENLGALRGQLGMGAMSQLQNLLQQGMRPTFENVYMQPTQGALGGMMAGAGTGAGMMGGQAGLSALSSLGGGGQAGANWRGGNNFKGWG
jgi:hypothetical protein